jgi:hypothetical protein
MQTTMRSSSNVNERQQGMTLDYRTNDSAERTVEPPHLGVCDSARTVVMALKAWNYSNWPNASATLPTPSLRSS